jgi:hypothetical protein
MSTTKSTHHYQIQPDEDQIGFIAFRADALVRYSKELRDSSDLETPDPDGIVAALAAIQFHCLAAMACLSLNPNDLEHDWERRDVDEPVARGHWS